MITKLSAKLRKFSNGYTNKDSIGLHLCYSKNQSENIKSIKIAIE